MRIQEFNEKVRIGSIVRYNRYPNKIVDINRTEHSAKLSTIGLDENGRGYINLNWIRCSEFEYMGEEV